MKAEDTLLLAHFCFYSVDIWNLSFLCFPVLWGYEEKNKAVTQVVPKKTDFWPVFLRGLKTPVFCQNSVTSHKSSIYLGEHRYYEQRKVSKHGISVTGITDIGVLIGKDLWMSVVWFTGQPWFWLAVSWKPPRMDIIALSCAACSSIAPTSWWKSFSWPS